MSDCVKKTFSFHHYKIIISHLVPQHLPSLVMNILQYISLHRLLKYLFGFLHSHSSFTHQKHPLDIYVSIIIYSSVPNQHCKIENTKQTTLRSHMINRDTEALVILVNNQVGYAKPHLHVALFPLIEDLHTSTHLGTFQRA